MNEATHPLLEFIRAHSSNCDDDPEKLLLWEILSSKLPALLREREHVCVHASELNVDVLGNQAVDF